jgi:archaeal type IV pilus assembly protein PilA
LARNAAYKETRIRITNTEFSEEVQKKKMKSFRRNIKGISPIFATLILIAIAVIAGVVVYMFTSGTLATMTGGGTTAQEKVSIQAAAGASAGGNFTVWAQCTSGGPVSITNAIVKDSNGNVLSTVAINPVVSLTVGNLKQVPGAYAFTSGNSYTITLVSAKGGNFVSSSFTAS